MSISTRCAILHRDGFTCVYCKKVLSVRAAQLDHIIPRKDGGASIATNLVTCCGPCNLGRQHDKLDPLLMLHAITCAFRPTNQAIGRELAREHYPSRMKTRAR